MTIRPAVPADARALAEHRAAVWTEVGDWGPEILDFVATWTAYLRAALDDGSYHAVIAFDESGILGSAGMHAKASLPRPEYRTDIEARVQGVHVTPAARRRGIARAMMERLLEIARAAGYQRIVLHPSDEARPLYRSLGFEPLDELVLRLPPMPRGVRR